MTVKNLVKMEDEFYLAFTGHRPSRIGGYNPDVPLRKKIDNKIRDIILKTYKKYSLLNIIAGGALGVDTSAAQCALDLNIPLILAIPCLNQDITWSIKDQDIYKSILERASQVVYVTEGDYKQDIDCMKKRNIWMVDNCDGLVAIWDGGPGGTAHCINYARSKKVNIMVVNPTEL